MTEPDPGEEFDNTAARFGVSTTVAEALYSLEDRTGLKLPSDWQTDFIKKLEDAAALKAKEFFEAGKLAQSDPRAALEIMGGEEGARSWLNPEDYEELMERVREQEGEQ